MCGYRGSDAWCVSNRPYESPRRPATDGFGIWCDSSHGRGEEGIAKVREILGGGADAALECVGTAAAVDQALGVLHNGGRLGFVGVPHYNNRALGSTFAQNISVAGGRPLSPPMTSSSCSRLS